MGMTITEKILARAAGLDSVKAGEFVDCRVDLVMGISYDDDISLAVKTIEAVLQADPRVLKDPEYQVAVSELADSSVNIVVRPWCAVGDYWGVYFDVTRAMKEQLEAAGCSIPYPQRDVHMHQVA